MTADTRRFISSAAVVLCVISLILLAAFGCRDAEAYISITLLLVMCAFVASTQDD